MSRKKHPHHGSTLDEFLEEERLTEEVNAIVQKRAIAGELREAMVAMHLSEVALAKRMQTSRTVVRNLLDPDNDSATLITLARAANAVGRRLRVGLEPRVGARVVLRKAGSIAKRSGRPIVVRSKSGTLKNRSSDGTATRKAGVRKRPAPETAR